MPNTPSLPEADPRLIEVILLQPRFCEGRANRQFLLTRQRRGSECGRKELSGLLATAAFKDCPRARQERLQR